MDDRGNEKTYCNLMAPKTEWFGEWFNSPYYHILYKKRDFNEAEQFISKLSQYLKMPPLANVLDLACGKGRHAIYLNQLGYNVTGLDLSQESIFYAKQVENNHLRFEVHDMRKPILHQQFDYIFNLFTSFGYFDKNEENQLAINSMSNALAPNGTLVIDFMNAHKVVNNLVKHETITVENITFNITKEVVDGYILKHINFEDNGTTYSFTEKVEALTEQDFLKYLNLAALTVTAKFGDYGLNNFDLNNSDRLILIAKK